MSNLVSVNFHEKVTRKELVAALDRILNVYSCPACGLNGYYNGILFRVNPADVLRDAAGGITDGVTHIETVSVHQQG